jgi:L-2-hydroxycarboxylate dehydrogenase (NAD+)
MASVSIEELESLCLAAFGEHGFEESESEVCIREIVDAECRGRRSHGIAMVPRLLEAKAGAGEPVRTLDASGIAHIDGNGALGPVVCEQAMELAIAKAEVVSVGLVGVRSDSSFLTAGYQPRRAAERGVIGVVVGVAAPKLAPWGAASPLIGTNPIGIGVPASPDPLVLDMSIGELTVADLRRAARQGDELPAGAAVSAAGGPTTDPAEALEGALLPFGGHRGSGLGVMIELLAGPLVGAHAGRLPGTARGALFAAVDPDCFGFGAEFAGAVRGFAEQLREAPPRDGSSRVLAPGDRGRERAREAQLAGLTVDDGAYEKLRAAASRVP